MIINTHEALRIVIAPVVVLVVHAVLLFVVRIYSLWPWFDVPMHFVGGVSIAVGGAFFLRLLHARGLFENIPRALWLLFLVSFVAIVAILWEFFEFLGGYFFSVELQGNLSDTMEDMFFGLLGGFVTGIMMLCFTRYGKNTKK